MDRVAVIATHHKGGTTWLNAVFQEIGQRLNIPTAIVGRTPPLMPDKRQPPLIVVAPHSKFKDWEWLIEDRDVRLLHLIRDPRDMIISAMHYHLVSREPWLHLPREELGGMTYQQKLQSLENPKSQYLFQIENLNAIRMMVNWDYGRENCFECRYEDLIGDAEYKIFTPILEHLGFSGDELEVCRQCFWQHSLFGGKAEKKGKAKHIRSGDARQWPAVFDHELALAFIKKWDDALVVTGYEKDGSWADARP